MNQNLFINLKQGKIRGTQNNDRPKLTHANDIKGTRTHANDVKGKRDGVIKVERKEDRISTLPDCLLLEILSRLPSTKYAIRTGALSKRWKHLWTSVHTLIFHHFDGGQEWSDFVSLVDKTLTQRPRLNLKKFDVQSCFYTGLESQSVNKWIHYAIRCNVEELDLALWHMLSLYKFVVDQFFFNNSCFTNLTLEGCILDPIGTISWKNLRSLYLFRLKLDDDMFQNILSGSPQLETLKLSDCYGYRRIDITSKSVKNLVLAGCLPGWCNYDEVGDITEINAPNIISVTIYGNLWLLTLLLVNVASLVQADLDYTSFGHWFTPPKEIEEKILKGFILKLCHAKELKIGSLCYEVVSRLRAKGFIFPSNVKFKSKPENRYLSLWGR